MNIKETDIAKVLIEELPDYWEIYQEVEVSGRIVDIVAKYSNILWAIECKKRLGVDVLAQAYFNKHYFHYSSVCTMKNIKHTSGSSFAHDIALEKGIGIFECNFQKTTDGYVCDQVKETIKPALNRKCLAKYIYLSEQQKTYAQAGNNEGKRWTPFRETVSNLVRIVGKNPGCKFSDAIKELDHHYSTLNSAKSCLRNLIYSGVIEELYLDQNRLFLKDLQGRLK